MGSCFSPDSFGIHRAFSTLDDEIVDSIFHERVAVRCRKETGGVGFVLSEEQIARPFTVQLVIAQCRMGCLNSWTTPEQVRAGAEHASPITSSPRPGIAKPKSRQHVQVRPFRAPIR